MPESVKKDFVIPVVVMTVVCIVVSFLLASVNALTRDRIAELAVQADDKSKRSILPEASTFTELEIPAGKVNVFAVMEGKDASGAKVGYVITSASRGYAGLVTVMTGIGMDGKIHDIQVIKDDETPGLGKKVRDKAFLSPFIGKAATEVFSVRPDETDLTRIDSVSGATISSRAVAEAVNKACAVYLDIKGGAN